MRIALYTVLMLVMPGANWIYAGLILPAVGTVAASAPNSVGAVNITVDFGITFDPAAIDRNSYTQEFSVSLGPDQFEMFEAFKITSSTGGSVLIGFGEDRSLLLSNPSPDLVFGNIGMTPRTVLLWLTV